jgi:hypothetical protein
MLRIFLFSGGALFFAGSFAMQSAPAYVVADWTFENGTIGAPLLQAVDQSGRGHNSVWVYGSPTYVPGIDASRSLAMECPPGQVFGSGFNVADGPDLVLSNEFTIEADVLARYDNRGYGRIIASRNGSGRSSYTFGYLPETDRFYLAVFQPGVEYRVEAPFVRDQFHHLAGTYQNGRMKLYRDGLLVASGETTIVPDPGPMDAVSVGVIFNGGFWFNGIIDRVRISNRALNTGQFFYQRIPEAWLTQYFGTNYVDKPEAAPDADPDGDGSTNLEEFQAGTHPLDATSGFHASIRAAPVVSWASVPSRTYRILRRDSLISTNWTTVISAFTATSSTSRFIDVDAPATSFYVVELLP